MRQPDLDRLESCEQTGAFCNEEEPSAMPWPPGVWPDHWPDAPAATISWPRPRSSATSAIGNMLTFNKSQARGLCLLCKHRRQRHDSRMSPVIEVLDGTASVRTYGGSDQTNDNVKYQYSMGDIARECIRGPATRSCIKVGVEGRVLLGPVGQPGNFNVPIRIAVSVATPISSPPPGKLYQVPTSCRPSARHKESSRWCPSRCPCRSSRLMPTRITRSWSASMIIPPRPAKPRPRRNAGPIRAEHPCADHRSKAMSAAPETRGFSARPPHGAGC